MATATPIPPQITNVPTYVDPSKCLGQALKKFTAEINPTYIHFPQQIQQIGADHFGNVYLGTMSINGTSIKVAVKTPKEGASDKDLADFLIEASTMGQFKHPNVIRLLGVVTTTKPYKIVTEYMENGSLDNFLKKNIGNFAIPQLLEMMSAIASGMLYLSNMKYVHRDLAARNILVDSCFRCKVADFGLSRWKDVSGIYLSNGVNIPIRWTAPEAICNKIFTSASDVWSFGIVMWEIMSYGKTPYGNCPNECVILKILEGYRLPPPLGYPEKTYQLMWECWNADKDLRPSFLTIVQTLEALKFGAISVGLVSPTHLYWTE